MNTMEKQVQEQKLHEKTGKKVVVTGGKKGHT